MEERKTRTRLASRRNVYLATILMMVGVTSGFALATITGSISASASGENGFLAAGASSTIYGAPGSVQSQQLSYTTATGTCNTGFVASGVTGVSYDTGVITCQIGTADWFQEFAFVSTVQTSGTTGTACTPATGTGAVCTLSFPNSDTFTVYANGVSVGTFTATGFTITSGATCTSSGGTGTGCTAMTSTLTVDAYLEIGPSATLTSGWAAFNIA